MIVIAIMRDQTRKVTRGRFIGKDVSLRVGIAIDNYNYLIALQRNGLWAGQKFGGCLGQLERFLPEFKMDSVTVAARVANVLGRFLERPITVEQQLTQVDKTFALSKRTRDNTGRLALYLELRKRLGKRDDDSDERSGSDVVLEELLEID